MSRKRRFRKVYFICEDNKAIHDNVLTATCYKDLEYATKIFNQQLKNRVTSYEWMKNLPTPKIHLEGFYLVN